MIELDREQGTAQLASLFSTRMTYAMRENMTIQPLPSERLTWLKERSESSEDNDLLSATQGRPGSWTQYYGSELRLAGRIDEAEEYLKRQIADAIESPDPRKLSAVLQQAANYVVDDEIWPLIAQGLNSKQTQTQGYSVTTPYNMLAMFTAKKRIDDDLSKGAASAKYRSRVISLFNHALQAEAEKPLKRRIIQLTGVGGPRSSYRIVGGNYEQVSIEFPPKGLGPNDQFVQAQHNAWEQMKGHSKEWISALEKDAESITDNPTLTIRQRIALATLL